jgi:uncharacterized RDD family membrane protein YckC
MSQPDYLISTPENVDLHLELAGMGNRVYACLVDTVLSYVLMMLVGIGCLLLVVLLGKLPMANMMRTGLTYSVVGLTILLEFAILFGYFIFFEGMWQGQSPGKRLAQIRVIEQNGQPVGWASVFIRNLVRVVDTGGALIGLLVMVVDKNERRLGDLAAGTLVIRERTSARSAGIDPQKMLESSRMMDVGRLTPREYDVLSSFLERRGKLSASQRPLLAKKLEDYFRTKLHEPTLGESPELFLEQLYIAYQNRSVS